MYLFTSIVFIGLAPEVLKLHELEFFKPNIVVIVTSYKDLAEEFGSIINKAPNLLGPRLISNEQTQDELFPLLTFAN